MAKIILYIAVSLNGKIARADGGIDWLENIHNPEKEDYGYEAFMKNIGTTIQGNKTYQQLLSWDMDFPYKPYKNYVITSDKSLDKDDNVTFLHSHIPETIQNIKDNEQKDIWLIGGAGANTLLLDSGLIDELMIFHIPTIIEDGIDLFHNLIKDFQCELINHKVYYNGVTLLHYKVKNER